MPRHFQSGVPGGILDAVFTDAEFIHSGNAVEAEFVGRMISDSTGLAIFPKVFIEFVGGDGKLGISAAVQNVFLLAVDLPQFFNHFHVVSKAIGLDTEDYSLGYIAGWSSGKDIKELKVCVGRNGRKTSSRDILKRRTEGSA